MKQNKLVALVIALFLVLQNTSYALGALSLQAASKPGVVGISGQTSPNAYVSLVVTDQIYGGRKYIGQVKANRSGNYSVDMPLDIGSYCISASSDSGSSETIADVTAVDGGTNNGGSSGSSSELTMTVSIQVTGDNQRGLMLGRAYKSYPLGTSKTVLDLLRDALTAAGISFVIDSNGYVKAIGGLKEFDRGANSGWLYYVNGVSPPVGTGSYTLNNGDFVEFKYSNDGLANDSSLSGGGGIPDLTKQETKKPPQALTTSDEKVVGSTVKAVDWATRAINELVSRGILKGDVNNFQPKRAITRAEFISLLYQAGAFKKAAAPEPSFTDVKPSAWCYEAIEGAAQSGIIGGFGDGTFRANQPLTRYQAAAIIRNLGDIKITGDARPADFKQMPEWAQPGVVYTYNSGLMSGYTGGFFRGERKIIRAEAAALLVNYLNAKALAVQPASSSTAIINGKQ